MRLVADSGVVSKSSWLVHRPVLGHLPLVGNSKDCFKWKKEEREEGSGRKRPKNNSN